MPDSEEILTSFDEVIFSHMNRVPEYAQIREELKKFLDQYVIIERQEDVKE